MASLLTRDLERRVMNSLALPLKLKKRRRKAGRKGQRDDDGATPPTKDGEGNGDDPPEAKDDDDPDGEGRDDDSPGTVEGYASVSYNEADPGTEYCLWEDPSFKAVERVARGAFSRAMKDGDDCRALYNHNPDYVLGRTTSGTLRLSEDEKGLRYEADLPDTQLARDLAESISRGDINGSSFGFVVEQESWRESEEAGGQRVAVRTIESVRLLDVGPVTYPAYSSTTTGAGGRSTHSCQRVLGSVEEARASYKAWKEGQKVTLPLEAQLAAARARAVEVEMGL